MKILLAIALALSLSLSVSSPILAEPVPDGWLKPLKDGGLLVNGRSLAITHCDLGLVLIVPKGTGFAIYDGPAMALKLKGKFLKYDVAPIIGDQCNASESPDKPKKKKKFYRTISN